MGKEKHDQAKLAVETEPISNAQSAFTLSEPANQTAIVKPLRTIISGFKLNTYFVSKFVLVLVFFMLYSCVKNKENSDRSKGLSSQECSGNSERFTVALEGKEGTTVFCSNKRKGESTVTEVWQITYNGMPAALRVSDKKSKFRELKGRPWWKSCSSHFNFPIETGVLITNDSTIKRSIEILPLAEADATDFFSKKRGHEAGSQELTNLLFLMSSEIVDGLNCLHDHDVAFNDLKPENILAISAKDSIQFQLTDLECIGPANSRPTCETPWYAKRNFLQSKTKSGLENDLFALGLSILAIAAGKPIPSGNQSTFFRYYLNNNFEGVHGFAQKTKISKLIQALTGYDATFNETSILKNSAELKALF